MLLYHVKAAVSISGARAIDISGAVCYNYASGRVCTAAKTDIQRKNHAMTDIYCLIAGLLNLLLPAVLVIFWHKRTGARFLPAFAAFAVCLPVFIIGSAIRSGFDRSSPIAFYIQQGLLFGIFEEGAKYLVLRYLLTSYDSRKDAVTYGIGHGAYEEFGCGLACLGLMGTGKAASDILLYQILSIAEGTVFVVSLTVIIFYGISMEKNIVTLPAAILVHAVSNASVGIFIEPVSIVLWIIIDIGIGCAAWRCWKAMEPPYEE